MNLIPEELLPFIFSSIPDLRSSSTACPESTIWREVISDKISKPIHSALLLAKLSLNPKDNLHTSFMDFYTATSEFKALKTKVETMPKSLSVDEKFCAIMTSILPLTNPIEFVKLVEAIPPYYTRALIQFLRKTSQLNILQADIPYEQFEPKQERLTYLACQQAIDILTAKNITHLAVRFNTAVAEAVTDDIVKISPKIGLSCQITLNLPTLWLLSGTTEKQLRSLKEPCYINFAHAYLVKRNLSNLDLSGCCFDHADLAGSDLSNTNFTLASLEGVNIEHCQLTGTDFSLTSLARESFEDENNDSIRMQL